MVHPWSFSCRPASACRCSGPRDYRTWRVTYELGDPSHIPSPSLGRQHHPQILMWIVSKGCQGQLLAPWPMPQPDTTCNMLILFDDLVLEKARTARVHVLARTVSQVIAAWFVSLQICPFVWFSSLEFTVARTCNKNFFIQKHHDIPWCPWLCQPLGLLQQQGWTAKRDPQRLMFWFFSRRRLQRKLTSHVTVNGPRSIVSQLSAARLLETAMGME